MRLPGFRAADQPTTVEYACHCTAESADERQVERKPAKTSRSFGECGSRPVRTPAARRRQQLCRPLPEQDAPIDGSAYTRTAQNEIYRPFHRLPNPDLVMYVFPDLAGTDLVPVPGYSTVFPPYQRMQYALPGERLEDF
ncbi:conjugative transfer region lipoprotein (TIGR03751 family) [Burkholderia ambifaria]|nr:conjugative transfer region lipoprotein (TIGR03751 family) [Burkholderia ambifaria]